MTTIIVNGIAICVTLVLGACLGIMLYAKTRSVREKEEMGIRV